MATGATCRCTRTRCARSSPWFPDTATRRPRRSCRRSTRGTTQDALRRIDESHAQLLRKWERAGLVQPRRDPQTSYRVCTPADVRDALLAHQLRRGGYLLEQIAPLIAQVRSAGGVAPLKTLLRDWLARLTARSRAMLTGAAALDAYLGCRPNNLEQL